MAALCLSQAAIAGARADSFQPDSLATANGLAVSPASLYPVGGPAMSTARVIADRYWQGAPCHGHVAIAWASMGSSVNATASWSNRGSAYADPRRNQDCSVRFNSDQAFDWPSLCTVFAHEFGHLTGHQHTSDPNDVMYPVYSGPLAACANTPPPPTGPGAAAATPPASPIGRASRARSSHHHRGARLHVAARRSRSAR